MTHRSTGRLNILFALLLLTTPLAASAGEGAASPPQALAGRSIPAADASGQGACGGTLICDCDPAGAEVYLNGKLLGQAPLRREGVAAGDYTLTLKGAGCEPSACNITIKKGATITVEDKLAPALGEVTINTRPEGAAVRFDGAEAGVSPLTIKRVGAGVHSIAVRLAYHDACGSSITLAKSERKSVSITLKRRLLLVGMVDGEPDGAGLSPGLEALLSAPFKKAAGLRVIPEGMKALVDDLVARGLDPALLEFLREQKTRLDIEDSSVLEGLMEETGAGLAMTVRLHKDAAGNTLTVTLYGVNGMTADRAVISARDDAGRERGLGGCMDKWAGQEMTETAARPAGAPNQ